ncbi:MAG: malto-oligosyltrehalose trehalohydrolase [Polyangiaceae bacterium]
MAPLARRARRARGGSIPCLGPAPGEGGSPRHCPSPDGDSHGPRRRRHCGSVPPRPRRRRRLPVCPRRRARPPDPRSRHQPHRPHGASRVVAPALATTTFRPPRPEDLVLYELHTGTFTPEGTFDAVHPRLKALADLGITAIELMPVAEFPGARNWGYDGVGLFAPCSAYGGPEALHRLVQACHAAGLAVILDVVYNHLGPEGNYLGEFGPYFTPRYHTPWGDALNYDDKGSDQVRALVIDNALSWVVEYGIDGLRLDAVHGIFDQSAFPLVEELSAAVHEEAAQRGRRAFVIAESDLNDPRTTRPAEAGGTGCDAQWSDDFHHALHVVLTGSRHGYFDDFGGTEMLAKAALQGFVYDGVPSAHRGRRHGRSAADLALEKLVLFTQNHDQIPNGSGGVRASRLLTFGQQKLAALLLLSIPGIPLLFMGQEYGETAPFHYFTSHTDPGLAAAVREGRRREFQGFGWEGSFHDPQSPETFLGSKLTAFGSEASPHTELRRLHRDLLRLRREHPSLGNGKRDLFRVERSDSAPWLLIERGDESGAGSLLILNFDPQPAQVPLLDAAGPEWRSVVYTDDPIYGGPPGAPAPPPVLDTDEGALARLTLPGHTGILYLAAPPAEQKGALR